MDKVGGKKNKKEREGERIRRNKNNNYRKMKIGK